MMGTDERVWCTYNGEAYNFKELRRELIAAGHALRSSTDTEVLVKGYEEWGIDCLLSRLRGMFAFAIYDGRRDGSPLLFLAKDRLGIKPLYYYFNGDLLLFASEVNALVASGLVPTEPNPEAILRFLQLGSVPIPQTTVKGVLALEAGHYLAASTNGLKSLRYWDPSEFLSTEPHPAASGSAEESATEVRQILDDCVSQHLVSDVPVGVFLSGGIDSSALVALASQHSESRVNTLTITFPNSEYSETEYAGIIAEKYHTDHSEVVLTPDEFFTELPNVFSAMDQPTIDGVNTYFISKAAKRIGLTVVLSGTGSDEIFLGYEHVRRTTSLEQCLRAMHAAPRLMSRGVSAMARAASRAMNKSGSERMEYLRSPSPENVYLLSRGLFSPRQISELLGTSEGEIVKLGPITSDLSGRLSFSATSILLDIQLYLQNQLLKDTDVMSMAHSIETRVPFLDHRLVEKVLALPTALKLNGHTNKPLLVSAMGDDLPRAVWDRPKMGFTFPFPVWMKHSEEKWMSAGNAASLFARTPVDRIRDDFRNGRIHWSRPWALAVLENCRIPAPSGITTYASA